MPFNQIQDERQAEKSITWLSDLEIDTLSGDAFYESSNQFTWKCWRS